MTLDLLAKHAGLRLDYDPSYRVYEKNSYDDYWQHVANGTAYAQLSKSARVEISDTFLKTENPISEEDFTIRRGQQAYYRNTSSARYDQQFGREDRFGLSYTYSFLKNKDPDVEDSQLMVPSADFIYWLGPYWGVEGRAAYQWADYEVSDDFQNWYGLGQLNRRFNPHFTGYVQFSFTRQEYDGGFGDFDVYDGGVGFNYQIDKTSKLQLGVNYFTRNYKDRKSADGLPVTLAYDKAFKTRPWLFRPVAVTIRP